jgi:hypothetical protein
VDCWLVNIIKEIKLKKIYILLLIFTVFPQLVLAELGFHTPPQGIVNIPPQPTVNPPHPHTNPADFIRYTPAMVQPPYAPNPARNRMMVRIHITNEGLETLATFSSELLFTEYPFAVYPAAVRHADSHINYRLVETLRQLTGYFHDINRRNPKTNMNTRSPLMIRHDLINILSRVYSTLSEAIAIFSKGKKATIFTFSPAVLFGLQRLVNIYNIFQQNPNITDYNFLVNLMDILTELSHDMIVDGYDLGSKHAETIRAINDLKNEIDQMLSCYSRG